MNKNLLLIFLLFANFSFAQVTTIYTKIELPQEVNSQTKIRIVFYNIKDTISVQSEKLIDTIVINQKIQVLYSMDVTSSLYQSLKNQVKFDSSGTILIHSLIFEKKTNPIEEVVITKNINPIMEIRGNKTSYSIMNNEAFQNTTLLEAIEKLPGVFNGLGNGLTINGRVPSILIDGLPINFSGQDLTNYLNSLSSINILKIEIINNAGAIYEANSSNVLINIITNKKNKKGVGGIFQSNATFYINKKYQSSLVLNGLSNKLSWNFTGSYSDSRYENSNDIRVYNSKNQESLGNYIFNSGRHKPLFLETSLSYPVFNNTSINFRYNILNSKENISSESNLNLDGFKGNVMVNAEANQYVPKLSNDVLFKINHKFQEDKNSISLIYHGLFFNKSTEYEIYTNTFNKNILDFGLSSNNLMLDTEFTTKYFKVNVGGKITSNTIESNGEYKQEGTINPKYIFFDHKERRTSFYTEIAKDIQKLNIVGGIRYENAAFKNAIKGRKAHQVFVNNFFPSLNLTYVSSPMLNFNLSYSKKIKLPNYQDLDPNNTSLYTNYLLEQGNPNLTPSISNNYEIRSNFLKMGFLSLSYSQTDVDNFVIAKYQEGNYVQSVEPFYNIRDFGSALGMPLPLGIITKGFAYANTITNINDINYLYFYAGVNFPTYDTASRMERSRKGIYYLGANSHFVAPFTTKILINYQFVSRGNYMIYTLDKSFFKVDLTINKSIINNNLKLSFSCQDIFKTATGIQGSLRNDNIDLALKTYSDTQRFRFGITYVFGNNKIKSPKNEVSNDNREVKKSSLDFRP